jgi:hypothetical protein
VADYYVDNSGADGDGSIGSPWNNVTNHINSLSAGDTMHVRGGAVSAQVYTEEIIVTVSGTNGSPITIQAYSDELVKFTNISDDNFDLIGDWLVLRNFEIGNEMVNSRSGVGVKSKGDNIVIDNLTIHDIYTQGIRLTVTSIGTTVQNCTIYNVFNGNSKDGTGLTINTGSGILIDNCTIYDCYGDCIQMWNGYTPQPSDVWIKDCLLYTTLENCSENAIDVKAGQFKVTGTEMYGFRKCDSTCGGTGSNGDAIITHYDLTSVEIDSCIIHDSTYGVNIAGGLITSCVIKRTLFYNMFTADVVESHTVLSSQDLEIYNCTFEDCLGTLLWLHSVGPSLTLKNCIFRDTGSIDENAGSPTIVADHNCWSNAEDTYSGTGDVTANPQFVDEAGNDYNLVGASPCVDAGVDVGLPYVGSLPDMGAFEYQGSEVEQVVVVVTLVVTTVVLTSTTITVTVE